jgi:hypothetical protein
MKTILLALFAAAAFNAGAVTFESPAANAVLTRSTALSGKCSGSADVKLYGDGIAKGKKISCRNRKYWEYSLENAFKNMKDGVITITVKQKTNTATRSFLKGSVAMPTPNPTPTPTPIPQPQPQHGVSTIDLKLWKITLPVDSSGGFSGGAVEVKNIPSDYQRAPYFVRNSDGSLTFSAPTDGATTSGSKYPRSELREMTASGANAAWTIEQGGYLEATLAVNEIPVKSDGSLGRVVIGQIHGPDDELNRLYYDKGQIYFVDDKAGSSQKETQFVLRSNSGAAASIPLNAKFDYSIQIRDGLQTVSVSYGGTVYSATETISSFWPGKALYFKAGIYVQVGKAGSGAGSIGTGKGTVTFYRLTPPTH